MAWVGALITCLQVSYDFKCQKLTVVEHSGVGVTR